MKRDEDIIRFLLGLSLLGIGVAALLGWIWGMFDGRL